MGLVVGEVDQRIMVHQAEVMGTLGDVVVPMRNKPEVEEARTVMAQIFLVSPVGTRMIPCVPTNNCLCCDWNVFIYIFIYPLISNLIDLNPTSTEEK